MRRDEAISFLNTAILRIQDAAPRAVRMVDRIKHELSTLSVLVHMCTRAGRYELAVEEASKAVRRAKELDSGLEDARNDLKLAEDVAARMVAISTVEDQVAEKEEAVSLEEKRTSATSAIDITGADDHDARTKAESAGTNVSVKAVVAAIPVLLSAVRELHKLSDLHVANARIGVSPMASFERALQAAEKAIDMQQVEVSKFTAAVKQHASNNDTTEAIRVNPQPDALVDLTARLSEPQHSAYDSLLDSLSRSYAHYGNTRLSFFRQTTMDKSDSAQLRRSRQLTLRAFEQAANTATTPLLRAYMISRQAEVQFNSAVDHAVVMNTLRQALSEADRGGLVLMKERILQQMSSAVDEEEEMLLQRRPVKREEQKEEAVESERIAAERAEVMSQLQTVQQLKNEQRRGLARELSAIRELDDELMLAADEEELTQSAHEQEAEEVEEVEVEHETNASTSSRRRSGRRRAAAARPRPSVTRQARDVLQAGRRAASIGGQDSVLQEKASAVLLLSEDEELDVMDEADNDAYDPSFVDPDSPDVNTTSLTHSVPLFSSTRSSSPVSTARNQPARTTRSHRHPSPSPPPSPPPAATHYDTDDSDVQDDQLGARTAQVVSARHDTEERKEEVRMEGARLLRISNIQHSHAPSNKQRDKSHKRRRRSSHSEELRSSDVDVDFIVEDRVKQSDHHSERANKSVRPRAPLLFSAVPSRRSMREMNASGQPWRAVCAQLLADRERSRADDQIMTQSNVLPTHRPGSASSRQNSNGSRDSRDRVGSVGLRGSLQRAPAETTSTQPRISSNRVERELVMLDAETETVTTRTETVYVDDMDVLFEQSPPRSQPQSQSVPLALRPANGPPHTTYSDPIVAYRPLRSVSLPRHSVRYEVEDLTDVLPLVAGADERSQALTDEELSAISMLSLADDLVQHIQRRTGRVCVIASISHRGELLSADHNALHVFQRHQQHGDRVNELPLLSIALDRWRPVALLDCYRTLCQTSSSLRIHPLVLQQLHSSVSATTIHFPKRPPPTLDSATLQPLFHALCVEPGVLTSLSLPAVPLQADAVVAFARSICSSQAPFIPLPTRLAYGELFQHAVFPLQPPGQQQEPLPRALTHLSSISLSAVKPSLSHLSELLASFALLPALIDLDLSDTLLSDDCLSGISFLLCHSSSLSRLNLSRALFRAEFSTDRARLIAALSSSKSLTELTLSHSHLSLETTTALLPNLVRLRHINFSSLRCLQPPTSPLPASSTAAGSGLSWFYSSLCHHLSSPLSCLTTVILRDVADVGGQLSAVIALALAVPSCRLQCVELCNNGLSLAGVLRLLAVLRQRNSTLRRLVLDGNRAVSDDAACTQLLAWISGQRSAAHKVHGGLCERKQQERLSVVGGLTEMCASCVLQELSVRRCGLSTIAQKQLFNHATNACAMLTLHM